MSISDNIWDKLGELPEDEAVHVLTKLFVQYESRYERDNSDTESINFFRNLDNALEQTTQCNLNRR